MNTLASTLPQSIQVSGRRWFQRTYGNTYCTASIYVNGVKVHTLPRQYGYGDYYLQAAGEWLDANGYTPDREKHASTGGMEPLWRYCNDRGISFLYSVSDVSRQKDL
jgi:hypothetical protein